MKTQKDIFFGMAFAFLVSMLITMTTTNLSGVCFYTALLGLITGVIYFHSN